ncbi:hypothetical protein [Streptomyces sp. NPDC056549]|uniref:hypothetical protein n=1 Tax=Streptomyces sp. NPDC056549 TaxID=3345864 RepID=UPI0036CF2638
MTTSPSSSSPVTEPGTEVQLPTGDHTFAKAYGPADSWDAATCALYVELHSTPPKGSR